MIGGNETIRPLPTPYTAIAEIYRFRSGSTDPPDNHLQVVYQTAYAEDELKSPE